jgi:hypothetical protein
MTMPLPAVLRTTLADAVPRMASEVLATDWTG